jgi:hypothetical protein
MRSLPVRPEAMLNDEASGVSVEPAPTLTTSPTEGPTVSAPVIV